MEMLIICIPEEEKYAQGKEARNCFDLNTKSVDH